jgi:hypothetical protein
MEPFLQEQLKRIQDLTERLSSLTARASELNDKYSRRDDEVVSHGPLADVKDLRPARSTADEAPRSRRRRRS